ncbi:MAG: hypothetical protein QOJ43_35 [Gaiellaceae bacterium]|nr:hypothetical protein [Gaiellaceae bacterium]
MSFFRWPIGPSEGSRFWIVCAVLVSPVWIAALAFYASEWILVVWSFVRALFP